MKVFTPAEVATHNKESDAWIIVDGKVYDVTSFLSSHPGGKKILLLECGKDATKKFHLFHQGKVLEEHVGSLCLGTVKADSKL